MLLTPFVGVHHQATQELFAALLGERYQLGNSHTICRNVGYFGDVPAFAYSKFFEGDDWTEGRERLLRLVEGDGATFQRAHATLESLEAHLRAHPLLYGTELTLSIVLHLRGRTEEGKNLLRARLDDLGAGPGADQYRAFAAAYFARFSSE